MLCVLIRILYPSIGGAPARGGWVEKIHAEYESVSIYLLGLGQAV